jgi:ABC-type bacteriocin/lantibiotic exporter with double-glycine peptidase domain
MPQIWPPKISVCFRGLALVAALWPAFAQAGDSCSSHYRKAALPPLVLQQTEYTCGAACVVSLVKQLKGKALAENHVAALFGTNRSIGTTPEKMVAGLGKLGFRAAEKEDLGLAALRRNFRRKRGQILLVQSGDTAHWVVLAGYKDGKITLMDPWKENTGYLTYTEEEFLKVWSTQLLGKKKNQLAIVVD